MSAVRLALAEYGYEASNEDELTFAIGQSIELLSTPEGGWWEGRLQRTDGPTGWFPCNYVKCIEVDVTVTDPPVGSSDVVQCNSRTVNDEEVMFEDVRWLDQTQVVAAQDNADLFRLLLESEKHYLETITQGLESISVLLKTAEGGDEQALVEQECALHKRFLVAIAREASKEVSDNFAEVILQWAAAFVVSCTAVAGVSHRTAQDNASEKDGQGSRGSMSALFNLPIRRLHEVMELTVRLMELSPSPAASDLLDVLTIALTVCDSEPLKSTMLPDPHGLDGPVILRCDSTQLSLNGGPDSLACLRLYEGLLIVEQESKDSEGNTSHEIVARHDLRMATVTVDQAAPSRVTIILSSTSPHQEISVRFATARDCAVWSGELYDQTVERPPEAEDVLFLSSIRPFCERPHLTEVKDDPSDPKSPKRWRFRKPGKRMSTTPKDEVNIESSRLSSDRAYGKPPKV